MFEGKKLFFPFAQKLVFSAQKNVIFHLCPPSAPRNGWSPRAAPCKDKDPSWEQIPSELRFKVNYNLVLAIVAALPGNW